MKENESLQFYLRVVKEKHSALLTSTKSLLRVLAGDDPLAKKKAAASALQNATDLKTILSKNDIPDWLNGTITYLTSFVQGNWSAMDLIQHLVEVMRAQDLHQWHFEKSSDVAFDFDSIFEHYKNESRLPELFEDIIRILEGIEASGEVDSVNMLKALGKVIATIKKSKDGSYFSLNSAWQFLISFLKNYMWNELSTIPILGPALEALGKTIHEADEEMYKVHKQVQEEMVKTVSAEVRALASTTTFPFATYDKKGTLLPAANTLNLPNTTA